MKFFFIPFNVFLKANNKLLLLQFQRYPIIFFQLITIKFCFEFENYIDWIDLTQEH